MQYRLIACLLAVALLCSLSFQANGQVVPGCGTLENAFGPFDYRDPEARNGKGSPLSLVENAHFTATVESLTKGISGPLIADIDYTLRAFPNHHRALNAVARYALSGGRLTSPNSRSADCYFQRALAFRDDDEVVHMLYANYLVKRGDDERALEHYEHALRLAPNSAEVNYNAGLFYLGVGNLKRAKELADIAYSLGYPLPGLRKKINEVEAKND
jgi:tetratricopeptide (TPR) repeat protein